MAKLTKPKYMKVFDIQKVLKYVFADGKRPHYIQLNPKPRRVAVVYISQERSNPDFKYKQGNSSERTILAQNDLLLPKKARIKANSHIYPKFVKEDEELSMERNQMLSFEISLDRQGYSRVHLNEEMSPGELFNNILKSVDIKHTSLSVITPENLTFVEKHDIIHMFSYSNYIKSQTNFDISTFDSYLKPKFISPYFLIAIDCEMMQCEDGTQVGRVSMLDHTGKVIYDKFVRPESRVTDYLEQYSGLNEENTSRGIALEMLREDLLSLIGTNTYLLGHGLENDLEALNFYTEKVIDTSYLFLNTDGYKIKLSHLSRLYFGDIIQNKSHCPSEDALCCLKLLAFKISQLKNFFDPNGTTLELGIEPEKVRRLEDISKSDGLFLCEESNIDSLSKSIECQNDLFIVFIYQIGDQKYVAFRQRYKSM